MKVVVVGDGGVGKTSLIAVNLNCDFPEIHEPTIMDNHMVKFSIADADVIHGITLIDTAGQEEFDEKRPRSYKGTEIFVICFSVVSPASFESVSVRWLPEIKEHCTKTPIYLVGTKTDLREDPAILAELAQKNMEPITAAQGRYLKTLRIPNYCKRKH